MVGKFNRPVHGKMSLRDYERTAAICGRWHLRSLDAVKALLVDGLSIKAVAEKFEISVQQVSVQSQRFMQKYELLSVDDFMNREQPGLAGAKLKPHLPALMMLRKKGYTVEQVVNYLHSEKGIDVSATTLGKFLKDNEA